MKIWTMLIALLWSSLAFGMDLDWKEIYTEDAVKVSRAEVADSKLYAFKGDTVMDAEIGRVLYVLLDNDHRLEWVGRLAHNQVLEQRSAFDYVIYQVFDLPAIFADRDYVYHGVASRDTSTGVVSLKMQSVEHADAPPTIGVRANLVDSRYRLTPLEGNKTRVEVEIITDPMGMMPAWLINLIQKSWPLDTLNGVRGQLSKPFTGVHELPGMKKAPAPVPEQAVSREGAAAEQEVSREANEATEAQPVTEEAAEKSEGQPVSRESDD